MTPPSTLLALIFAILFAVSPAAAKDRVEWTTSAARRTKTIYDKKGAIIYQAHWDKATGDPVGVPLDHRARHRQPKKKAPVRRAGTQFSTRSGQLVLVADSLVRVRFTTELHSGRNRTGDKFEFTVVDPIKHEGRTLLAKGKKGWGSIRKARRRGSFGKSGRLELDFGPVTLAGGEKVNLLVNKTSDEANQRTLTAAGTSAGAALLLGPIGLAGGVFMKGRDVHIPKGSTTHLAVQRDVVVR